MKPLAKKLFSHLILFVVVCILLFAGLNIWLNRYTHHNSALLVPDLSELSTEEAFALLQAQGLRYDIIDSVYVKGKTPGSIMEQTPAAGAKVKINRIIYLTLYAGEEESMIVPFVKDYSRRQAIATLEAVGFRVSQISYAPSVFKGLVLDIQHHGVSIEAGTTLPIGSDLTLVVGQGKGSEQILVPNFIGMPLDSAILLARSQNVNIGNVLYDKTPDNEKEAENYFVYQQSPLAGSYSSMGKHIDLQMTKNTALLLPKDSIPLEFFYE